MTSAYYFKQKISDSCREFIDSTIKSFKMDIDPQNWTEKNSYDWLYWIRFKLRFQCPNIKDIKEIVLDLSKQEALNLEIWIEQFGDDAGLAMFKEFTQWLLYRDWKNVEEKVKINERAENFIQNQSNLEAKIEGNSEKSKLKDTDHKKLKKDNEHTTTRRNEKKKGLYLWQVLLTLLLDSSKAEIISWSEDCRGNFKILKPEEVSRIWGHSKGNPKMTYDKMSRSMRQYYKSELLIKTNRDKLNYCFNLDDPAVKKFIIRYNQDPTSIKNLILNPLYPSANI